MRDRKLLTLDKAAVIADEMRIQAYEPSARVELCLGVAQRPGVNYLAEMLAFPRCAWRVW